MGIFGALEKQMKEIEEDVEERCRHCGLFERQGMDDADDDGQDSENGRDRMMEEDEDDDNFEEQEEVNLEAFDIPLREWIAQDKTYR